MEEPDTMKVASLAPQDGNSSSPNVVTPTVSQKSVERVFHHQDVQSQAMGRMAELEELRNKKLAKKLGKEISETGSEMSTPVMTDFFLKQREMNKEWKIKQSLSRQLLHQYRDTTKKGALSKKRRNVAPNAYSTMGEMDVFFRQQLEAKRKWREQYQASKDQLHKYRENMDGDQKGGDSSAVVSPRAPAAENEEETDIFADMQQYLEDCLAEAVVCPLPESPEHAWTRGTIAATIEDDTPSLPLVEENERVLEQLSQPPLDEFRQPVAAANVPCPSDVDISTQKENDRHPEAEVGSVEAEGIAKKEDRLIAPSSGSGETQVQLPIANTETEPFHEGIVKGSSMKNLSAVDELREARIVDETPTSPSIGAVDACESSPVMIEGVEPVDEDKVKADICTLENVETPSDDAEALVERGIALTTYALDTEESLNRITGAIETTDETVVKTNFEKDCSSSRIEMNGPREKESNHLPAGKNGYVTESLQNDNIAIGDDEGSPPIEAGTPVESSEAAPSNIVKNVITEKGEESPTMEGGAPVNASEAMSANIIETAHSDKVEELPTIEPEAPVTPSGALPTDNIINEPNKEGAESPPAETVPSSYPSAATFTPTETVKIADKEKSADSPTSELIHPVSPSGAMPIEIFEKAKSKNDEKNKARSGTASSSKLPCLLTVAGSNVATLGNERILIRQRSPTSRKAITCNSKWIPHLHPSVGGCEQCLKYASIEERAMFEARGHHHRVMMTNGGCSRNCSHYPRSQKEPAVRLCRKCFHDKHVQRPGGDSRVIVLETHD